jgi:protein arginine kinase activator
LTNIAGDKMQKVDLCEDCAKSKGMNDPTAFSLADQLFGLGAALEIEQAGGGTGLKCSACGFTQADFKKAGRLGCSQCYATFAEPLEGLLKTMHKGTRHVGKVPEALRKNRDLSDRLKLLQKKLGKAIDREDFEEAAILRDEIKQTSARTSNPTPP